MQVSFNKHSSGYLPSRGVINRGESSITEDSWCAYFILQTQLTLILLLFYLGDNCIQILIWGGISSEGRNYGDMQVVSSITEDS